MINMNSKKNKKIISIVIIAFLVVAMIVPLFSSMFY
ncbi:MAG: synaptobrevin-B [Acetatifactor sp.]|nr:synaptobrevin-B [Acetatifactor sp.]